MCKTTAFRLFFTKETLQLALPKLSIRKGREWQLLRGHPWLFSGGISQAPGKCEPGSLVDLVDLNGKFVARGYFNPECDIAVRILTLNPEEEVDQDFLDRRVRAALELRKRCINLKETDVFRLINSEGDYLPGFIVDSYADSLVVQSHTAGSDKLLEAFLNVLERVTGARRIVLRNDAAVRRREGLNVEPARVLVGEVTGPIIVSEHGLKFVVDLLHGQKTGFFSDQRDKREWLMKLSASLGTNARVANCFSYSAGFAIAMAKGNAAIRTVNIDESQKALDQGKRNFEMNSLSGDNHEFVCADAFKWLESEDAKATRYDLVILDPPAFAKTHKEKNSALKGYTRLNELGMKCVAPGGLLMSCSCTGSVAIEEFRSAIQDAAVRAGRKVQIVETFQNGADHPVVLAAPETSYLKVFMLRIE